MTEQLVGSVDQVNVQTTSGIEYTGTDEKANRRSRGHRGHGEAVAWPAFGKLDAGGARAIRRGPRVPC
jgi:hypothetical protein